MPEPSRSRVLVTSTVLHQGEWPYVEILQRAGLEVQLADCPGKVLTETELLAALAGMTSVVASVEPYTRRVLQQSQVAVIARVGVGYDAIDVTAANDHSVAVTITPGANHQSVAETTIALLTGISRGFPQRDHAVRLGRWRQGMLPRLAGQTLGLLGLGRAGRAVVPKALGLGLKVVGSDPLTNPEMARSLNIELVSQDQLLAQSDIVSLHLPATKETANLINRQTLQQMKPGSVLINTSRGALVDEEALAEALAQGHLLGAGLDVFQVEPPPPDHPLLQLDNVLLSPHVAGLDLESLTEMSNMAAQSIVDLFQGRWPEQQLVNPEIRGRWSWDRPLASR